MGHAATRAPGPPAPARDAIPYRMRAMRQRLAAFVALVATLCNVALPAHAHAHLRAPQGMLADLCTARTATPAPAAPESPRSDACDACASCSAHATPPSVRATLGVAGAYVACAPVAPPRFAIAHVAHFAARAPPILR